MAPTNPAVRKAAAAPDSMLPVGLAPLVNRFRDAITGGGKRRREEEAAAAKKASAAAAASDPIEDADEEGEEQGTYLTLATVDWSRYKPLILPPDEDDRAALALANGADGGKAVTAAGAAGGVPQFVARVEGAASGVPLLLGNGGGGAPASQWRGTEEEDDDEEDKYEDGGAGRGGRRATRGGSKRAPASDDDDDDESDDGEESEEERLRVEEAVRTAAIAADAAAKAAAAAAAAAAAHKHKKAKRHIHQEEEEEEARDGDGDDLDFRLSEAGWPGASIVGAHKRDGATAIRVSWDDGEERWVDSSRLHEQQHTLKALVEFYESKAKNKG